jgi:PqqD family protein of HPr-rel-A system
MVLLGLGWGMLEAVDPEQGMSGLVGRAMPRRAPNVLELDMGDGVVLYDDASSLVHHLNPSASFVWHLVDGDATLDQLVIEISEELELESPAVLDLVRRAITELEALGLIEMTEAAALERR